MNIHKNQKGFGGLELVLIIVIILGLGGIGWFVYNSNHKTQQRLDQVSKVSSSVPQSTKKTESTSQKFVFKELGVQITLPDSLKGLEYSAEQGTSVTGQPATFIYLTSDGFKDYLKSCNATGPSYSFGAVSKATGVYPSNPTLDNSDGALLKQFDGFYIEGAADQQTDPCASDSDSQGIENERSTLFSNLTEAFKTATLVQ